VAAALAILVWRRGSPSRPLWTPRAVGLVITLVVAVATIGVARAADTPATSSRYLYFPAILMLLLACEWTQGLTVRRPRLAAAGALLVVLAVLALGVQQLRDGKAFYLQHADGTAARTGAMRLARGPSLVVEPSRLAYTPAVLAAFVRRYGAAPLDTEAQLARALPQSRAAADQVLAQADVRPPGPARGCHRWAVGAPLPRRNLIVAISRRAPGPVRLIRFAPPADGVAVPLRAGGAAFALRRDAAARPWQLALPPGTTVRLCA